MLLAVAAAVAACGAPAAPVVTTTVVAGAGALPGDDTAIVAVDGVRLEAPDRLAPADAAVESVRSSVGSEQASVLVVSNWSPDLGRYDGDLAGAMLTDPADRQAVVDQTVRAADGFDGVQLSLFGLAAPTSDALVSFAGALRAALPEDTTVSLTIIASTDFGGYRERGVDVEALAGRVDRLVLQTYEPGEVGRPPQPIDDPAGIEEEIEYLVTVVDADVVDLGVSPLAGIDAAEGLRLATDAGLHGLVVGRSTARG